MKTLFVKLYLYFVAIVLSITFVGKVPAILRTIFGLLHVNGFLPLYLCMETPLFGSYQPLNMSNDQLLAVAAGIELFIVMLIGFCRARWVPCLASALWGSICVAARVYFMSTDTDCGCLGWLAKPGPTTNLIVGLMALAIAAGGWVALAISLQNSKHAGLAPSAAVS